MDTRRKTDDDGQRIEKILAEMKTLEGRDLQVWSISLSLLLVLIAGVGLIMMPVGHVVKIESRVLLLMMYGLISVVVLFNIYVIRQRRTLRLARGDLVRELMRAETAAQMADEELRQSRTSRTIRV